MTLPDRAEPDDQGFDGHVPLKPSSGRKPLDAGVAGEQRTSYC